jgi:hypothetical protein
MLLNQIPCTNEEADSTKCFLASFRSIINFNLRPSEAEAGPNGVHNHFFNIFSCLQVILHVKPFLHPSFGPPFPECWHRVACVGVSDKSITTKVVMILFFSHGLRLIYMFMHTAKSILRLALVPGFSQPKQKSPF